MERIVTLDIGTNSIGWTLFDQATQEYIDAGSRIFSAGVNDLNQSKETTKSKDRTEKRGSRRRYYRYKLRRKRLKKLLSAVGMLPPDDNEKATRTPNDKKKKGYNIDHTKWLYGLRRKAVNQQLELAEIGRILMQLNHRRGFKSSKKELAAIEGDEKKQKADNETTKFNNELNIKIKKALDSGAIQHGTVGEYFCWLIEQNAHSHDKNQPFERIRGEKYFVSRALYQQEFDLIWSTQKKYYPAVLTDDLYAQVRDQCIFFQRNLRSQKHLRNRCKYEFTEYFDKKTQQKKRQYKPCAPKSDFDFQLFRIWEQVNNLRYTDRAGNTHELTLEQKKIVADALHNKEKIGVKDLKGLLNLSNSDTFKEFNDLKGNVTNCKLQKAIGEKQWQQLNEQQKHQLWQMVHFAADFPNAEEWIVKNLSSDNKKQWQLTAQQIQNLSKVVLEADYCAYSHKALRKLLPYMQQGHNLYKAESLAGYNHVSDITIKPEQLQALVPYLQPNQLRNPIVQKSVQQAITVINAIIRKHGKPDGIRIEMVRELKQPLEVRAKKKKNNDAKKEQRERYAQILTDINGGRTVNPDSSMIQKFELYLELEFTPDSVELVKKQMKWEDFEFFCKKVTTSDTQKYNLWKQCDRRDIYTGKNINVADLFSDNIQIEHIVPYSRCLDNSFANKTVTFREFNMLKGKLTPCEYFAGNSKLYKEFEQRVKNLESKGKQTRFLIQTDEITGFRNSQLSDTAYIAKALRLHLLSTFEKVEVVNGQATALLRRWLGFDTLIERRHKNVKLAAGNYWAVVDYEHKLQYFIPIADTKDKEKDSETEKLKVPADCRLVRGKVFQNEKGDGIFVPDKNRNDHRHHVVDAMTIAVISVRVIQILETISQLQDAFDVYGEWSSEARKAVMAELEKTGIPIKNLRQQAQQIVNNLIVSHQAENRITASARRQIYLPNGQRRMLADGKTPYKSNGIVARKPLHEDTYYGKITQPDTKQAAYVVRKPLSFFEKPEKITRVVDKNIRNMMFDFLIQHPDVKQKDKETLRKFKNGLATDKNDKMEIDTSLFYLHVQQGTKTVVTQQSLLMLPNKNGNPIPINKVRVANRADAGSNDNEGALKPIRVKESTNGKPHLFVETGGNYAIALYGELAIGEKQKRNAPKQRDYKTLSYFDAAQITAHNRKHKLKRGDNGWIEFFEPRHPQSALPLLLTLAKGDMVLVFEQSPDEVTHLLGGNNPERLFARLFKVVKADTNGVIVLMRHYLHDNADKAEPVSMIDACQGVVIRTNYNNFKGIKARVDELGNVRIAD